MTDQQKKYIAWLVVVVAILVAGFLGVTYPIPAPPLQAVQAGQTVTLACAPVTNLPPGVYICTTR